MTKWAAAHLYTRRAVNRSLRRPATTLLALTLLVACSGSSAVVVTTTTSSSTTSSSTTSSSSTTTSSTTTTIAPTTTAGHVHIPSVSWPPYSPLPGATGSAPLTGLAGGGDAPIVAVKIDNSQPARGQWGLDGADVVFEENVEGVTRFIALFQSRQPAEVGPVRSARTGDLYLLSGMNRPILAWSGGNAGVTAWVQGAADAGRLVNLSALRVHCYRRDASKPKPHNLVLDVACARSKGIGAGAARPLWEFGTVTTGTPTAAFDVRMNGGGVHWEWDATNGYYVRWMGGAVHTTAGGVPLTATNVVIVSCTHIPSPADGRSLVPVTVGSGKVTIHSGGLARTGTWVRALDTDPWTFIGDDGATLVLNPGTTYVELPKG
ncbi:unannotated protein [freshwater metagenome]|uniref:Unannotated protein n=1 Tax=freshwater metagenome TaxID=449393 RepID=A0A6J7C3L3_9ZZZZ